MPEQSAHRQENFNSDQQPNYYKKLKGEMYENNRQDCTGRLQCGIERNRLRAGIGLIEFERTKEILLDKLPKPPAVIYDTPAGC